MAVCQFSWAAGRAWWLVPHGVEGLQELPLHSRLHLPPLLDGLGQLRDGSLDTDGEEASRLETSPSRRSIVLLERLVEEHGEAL